MPVKSRGPKNARICFIGEAPGENEILNGIPFIGKAGQYLRSVVKSFGVDSNECYYINVFDVRPPGNKVEFFYQDKNCMVVKEEFKYRISEFVEELAETDCNIYVLLGNTPLYHLTHNKGINKYRGSIFSILDDRKAIATLHPSAVIRQFAPGPLGNYRQLFQLDISKAIKNSETKGYEKPKRVYHIPKMFDDQMDVIKELHKHEFLSCDIESLWNAVSCIGFAPDGTEGYCIPFVYNFKWMHSDEKRAKLWQAISKLLHNPESKKIWQNGYFDYSMLGRLYRIRPVNIWMDTIIAHHCCYPEMRKGLDFLASIYTNEIYWKDDGKQWNDIRDYQQFWEYNINDACVTYDCAMEIQKHVELYGLVEVVEQYTRLTYGPVLKATLMGVNYDVAHNENYRDFITKEIDRVQGLLENEAGKVNVNSPKQIAGLLYDELGYPKQYKTVQGKKRLTSDEEAIIKCKLIRDNKVLDMILSLRRMMKLRSTYIDMRFDPFTSRMHTSYNTCGTETGRLSSSKAPWGIGGNFQNPPRKDTERKAFYENNNS